MDYIDELKRFLADSTNLNKDRVATKRELCKLVYTNYMENPAIPMKLPDLCEYFKRYPPESPYYSLTMMNYFDGALYRTFWMKYH